MSPKIFGTLALIATLVWFGGCSAAGPSPPPASSSASAPAPRTSAPPSAPQSSSAATTRPPTSSSTARAGASAATILDAITIARRSERGVVVEAELSREGEASAWKVDIRRSRDLTMTVVVTASDGRVVRKTGDETDEEARTVPRFAAAAAVKAAAQRVRGQVTSVELDENESDDRDTVEWKVKVRRPGQPTVVVHLDARTGAFLRQSTDEA